MGKILSIAQVPVIFLSAYSRDEIIARAIDAGAVDYMVKPFSPIELVARVRGALRRGLPAAPVEPSSPLRAGGPGSGLRQARGQRGLPPDPSDAHRV